ncbi:efflux transporter outer membrane subunit [Undibacterium sp. SXout7W]|uniref:efflux transporter outer membrane subunit n=1 Tax=Undibacterium sp. SXout7W TaxID=3413049 RepID=UPI003BF103A2
MPIIYSTRMQYGYTDSSLMVRYLSHLSRLITLLVPLYALCACVSTSDLHEQTLSFKIPASWTTATATTTATETSNETQNSPTSLVEWWKNFNDPVLDILIAHTLQNNTNINIAQASLRQAWALRDVAAAALWPSLSGSASAQHDAQNGKNTSNIFQVGVSANWIPDLFGFHRSAINAADATAQSSMASLGDVQVSIAAEAGLSYITLRNAEARMMIASENLVSQEDTLRITQWRQQAGLVTILESEQARSQTEQTRALLPTLQTTIRQTRHTLAILTGRPPTALASLLSTKLPVPQVEAHLTMSIPAETLRQRADVRTAELKMVAALAYVAQAKAARMPSFSLAGSLGANSLTLGTLTNSSSMVSSLITNVAIPIIDGGALRAQIRSQQAVCDQLRLSYESVILTALKEVEDALIALQNDRQRLVSLQHASDAATTASLLARQRFSTGLVDFQIVLETQRTQLNIQDSLASAQAEVSSDHIRLYKALGGGWNADAVHRSAFVPISSNIAIQGNKNRNSTR